jgi:D-serine deaminase-like pyridoxal phosphate-dependent protein
MTAELRAAYDQATKDLDAPLAIVDLDAFDANVADLARRANGMPIRIASKSVRCRHLLARALSHDGFEGLLCYSLAEAMWLWRNGSSRDLVLGYPTVDAAALRDLAAEPDARACITLMIDSTGHLDYLDAVLGLDHPEIRVALELDAAWRPLRTGLVHVGTRRSPVHSPSDARALAQKVLRRKGFRLVGLMAYEGQIAGIGDKAGGNALKSAAIRLMQSGSANEIADRRAAAVRAVRAIAELEFVNGGGTGSVETTTAETAVTEVAAGSGLIGPTLFDDYRRFQPRPAVLFALPVVRKPTPNIATLGFGGYIASGPPGASRVPRPFLPEGLRLVATEGAGEVQTPVTGAAARQLRIGDKVWLRHAKAGEPAERFDSYHVVRDGTVIDTVATYRGEGRNFG